MAKHIILAEDTEQTRTTFATVLRKAGYEVTEAKDGQEALRHILARRKDNKPVDLLITDIWMDGLNGLQLTDQLAKLGLNLPILAITGYGDKELVIELMRRGCQDYVEKPFEAVELLECVAKLFKKIEQPPAAKK